MIQYPYRHKHRTCNGCLGIFSLFLGLHMLMVPLLLCALIGDWIVGIPIAIVLFSIIISVVIFATGGQSIVVHCDFATVNKRKFLRTKKSEFRRTDVAKITAIYDSSSEGGITRIVYVFNKANEVFFQEEDYIYDIAFDGSVSKDPLVEILKEWSGIEPEIIYSKDGNPINNGSSDLRSEIKK